jgi:hypothetical protein
MGTSTWPTRTHSHTLTRGAVARTTTHGTLWTSSYSSPDSPWPQARPSPLLCSQCIQPVTCRLHPKSRGDPCLLPLALHPRTSSTPSSCPNSPFFPPSLSAITQSKRRTPLCCVAPGLFWMLEQLPGPWIYSLDMTPTLASMGYWASYNVMCVSMGAAFGAS